MPLSICRLAAALRLFALISGIAPATLLCCPCPCRWAAAGDHPSRAWIWRPGAPRSGAQQTAVGVCAACCLHRPKRCS